MKSNVKPKILTKRPKSWPDEAELTRMDKILAKAKGSRMLPPNAEPVDRIKYDLCQKFVKYCIEHDVTQRELAQLLDVSESRVSEIVHYHIDKLTLDRLIRYLAKLNPKLKFNVA